MKNTKIKVLFIAGEGRSGSTIIGAILGEIENFLFTGELMSIWKHFFIEDKTCTCGSLPSECSVWNQIVRHSFAHVDKEYAITIENYRKYWVKNRSILYDLLPGLKTRFSERKDDYLKILEHLYCSIGEFNNTEFIIDDSKRPAYGKLLEQIDSIDLYVLHLVRDPRAVAFSWQRRKIQTDGRSHIGFMYQYTPIVSAYRWNIHNYAASYLFNKQPEKYCLLRYEDFINNPKHEINNIIKFLGVTEKSLPFLNDDTVNLSVNHAVWGNPVRHKTGKVKLINDNEWMKSLKMSDRVQIELLTYPLRKKYGY